MAKKNEGSNFLSNRSTHHLQLPGRQCVLCAHGLSWPHLYLFWPAGNSSSSTLCSQSGRRSLLTGQGLHTEINLVRQQHENTPSFWSSNIFKPFSDDALAAVTILGFHIAFTRPCLQLKKHIFRTEYHRQIFTKISFDPDCLMSLPLWNYERIFVYNIYLKLLRFDPWIT